MEMRERAWLRGLATVLSGLAMWLPSCHLGHTRSVENEGFPPPITVARQTEEAHRTENVILVTLDGARWQEIFHGVDPELARRARMDAQDVVTADRLLPNLYGRMIPRGVAEGAPGHAAPMSASGPNFVSLPGYLEIFHGRPSPTCRSNHCDPTTDATIADEVRAMPGAGLEQVAVISSWETIANAATRDGSQIVLSAGRHHGPTRNHLAADPTSTALLAAAESAAPSPGEDDYRPDRFTAPLALRYLAAKRPRFLFVGLGDPDEHAHHGDYPAYVGPLRAADAFLGELLTELESMGDYGAATSVIVTCDHGRARDFRNHGGNAPESGRVWMVAYGASIPALGYASSGSGARLSDIAPSIRTLLGLGRDAEPGGGSAIASLFAPTAEGAREASR